MLKSALKRLLNEAQREKLKSILTLWRWPLIRLMSGNGFFASVYYAFFSRQFYREHQASLVAQQEFKKRFTAPITSSSQLRRNIHRLEKGLIMQPRKAVFAEAYIGQTLDVYLAALKSKTVCHSELGWASDVLSEYFAVVSETAVIKAARQRFIVFSNTSKSDSTDLPSATPYRHQHLPANSVSFQQLQQLFIRRRSVRWFEPRQVDDTVLQQAIDAALTAPSACNRQPVQFHIINNNERAAEVAGYAMGTVGFAQNIPCLLVIVGDLSAYEAERDRHVIYIDASLAAMQLMLALETLGLQSCPINWPDVEPLERKMAAALGLALWQRPVMLLAVGYAAPDGGIAFSQKKPAAQVIFRHGS